MSASVAAALRPTLVFLFADPGLPLQPLLSQLSCYFGLASIDMDELVGAAPGARGAARAAAAKHKLDFGEAPASVMCPALIDRVEYLQNEGTPLPLLQYSPKQQPLA